MQHHQRNQLRFQFQRERFSLAATSDSCLFGRKKYLSRGIHGACGERCMKGLLSSILK
jgi:hypothetical protein